jgi:hypothetical protein
MLTHNSSLKDRISCVAASTNSYWDKGLPPTVPRPIAESHEDGRIITLK